MLPYSNTIANLKKSLHISVKLICIVEKGASPVARESVTVYKVVENIMFSYKMRDDMGAFDVMLNINMLRGTTVDYNWRILNVIQMEQSAIYRVVENIMFDCEMRDSTGAFNVVLNMDMLKDITINNCHKVVKKLTVNQPTQLRCPYLPIITLDMNMLKDVIIDYCHRIVENVDIAIAG